MSADDSARIPLLGRSLHAGSSKAALDVLNDVAAEFIMNIGRTMRFLVDEHGQKMTPEVRSIRLCTPFLGLCGGACVPS